MNIIADEIKLKQDVVTYRVCEKLKEFTLNSYQFDGLIWKTNAYGSSEKSKVTIWRLC